MPNARASIFRQSNVSCVCFAVVVFVFVYIQLRQQRLAASCETSIHATRARYTRLHTYRDIIDTNFKCLFCSGAWIWYLVSLLRVHESIIFKINVCVYLYYARVYYYYR